MYPPRHGPHVGVETTHPASANVLSNPSSIACNQTRCVAGMTMHRTPGATFLLRMISAATRMSDILPLVHEPITTWSIGTSPASSTLRTLEGRCGNATTGFSSARSISTSRSYSASASAANARGGFAPCSERYAIQMSSTGKMPFFAPASMAMLAMVKRSSMPSAATPSPVNSSDWYRAPSTPIMPIRRSTTSLPQTQPRGALRSTTLIADGTRNQASPVAIPAAASVEPTPVENAPSAPYVHVCESAPITQSPAVTSPFSGSSACSTPQSCPTSK